MNRKKLGRGLQALMGMDEAEAAVVAFNPDQVAEPTGLAHLPLDEIDLNPYQPRREFDPTELESLAQSIQSHGVIQPIVVRPVEGRYQLVAGERRFRAAKTAGLPHIPARVLELDERQTFELALIENLQRKDLNAIEKAQAFQGYLQRFQTTHEELAAQLGVDRSTVTNLVRLLDLPESVQDAVRSGQISYGHARALLSIDDPVAQIACCQKVVADALSVRQTEALVKDFVPAKPSVAKEKKQPPAKSNHLLSLENDLRHRLGAKVEIQPRTKDQGTIVIHFGSNDDFERLMAFLTGGRGH